MMVNEIRSERGYKASQPFDSTDNHRFGQVSEICKDAIAYELKQFFDYKTADGSSKIAEHVNIQKYGFSTNPNEQGLETSVNLIMAYADTPDRFPLISITSANLRERKLNLGSNYVCQVQYAPSITGTANGTFNLSYDADEDPHYLTIITYPGGDEESVKTSTITFASSIFADISSVTAVDIARVIMKTQALYYTIDATTDGNVMISAGGIAANPDTNYIEITGGSAVALTQLGFTVGSSADYTDTNNPRSNRYSIAADMTVNIDVVSDDINTRTELQDLVFDFFAFYLEKRRFQLFGRSYFDRDQDPPEWWHLSVNNQFSWSSEITRPRQDTENYDQIYAIRGSIPIFIEDFLDRNLVETPVFLSADNISLDGSMNPDNIIPDGDYPGDVD